MMDIRYTNDMRQAVNALDNPVPVAVNISQKGDQIYLVLDRREIVPLSEYEYEQLRGYVKDIQAIIRVGGGGNAKVAIVDGL